MSTTSSDPREQARLRIIQQANRVRRAYRQPLFCGRHLQQAVQIVRHWGLVKPEVLEVAGFKATRRPVPVRNLRPTRRQSAAAAEAAGSAS